MRVSLSKFYMYIYSYNAQIFSTINGKLKSKYLKKIINVLIAPLLILRSLILCMYEKIYAERKCRRLLQLDKKGEFIHELAIVAIAKNEATYIREWISYHLAVGADIIYLYDNDSDDHLDRVVQDYIDKGVLVYHKISGKKQQLSAYEDALKRYGDNCRWMAIIDCDEFIMPFDPCGGVLKSIDSVLQLYGDNAAGLAINWAIYGSSNQIIKKDGLVVERFLNRAEKEYWVNRHIKTICNPRFVKRILSPHYPTFRLGCWNINTNGQRVRTWYNYDIDYSVLRCNHYYCKSKDEFMHKKARGMADRLTPYDMKAFSIHDRNEVHDESMLRYIDKIKENM